ncbi:hypothetical protein [Natronosporangium hydrolyticum]|nr:hypothetical protein [Natronosporangium hydrolyticum]
MGAAALGATGAVTGCSWWDEPEPPPPDPLEPFLAQTRSLAARYDDAIAVHPELAELLSPIQQAHREHEGALLTLIGRPELATPPPGATPEHPGAAESASPGSESPAADPAPADPDTTRELLRDAEVDGQAEAVAACLTGTPERAALLGSIAAARATHAAVLA